MTLSVTQRQFESNSYIQMQRNIHYTIYYTQNYKNFYDFGSRPQYESLVITTVIAITLLQISFHDLLISLGRLSAAARLLGLPVRIPPWAWLSASCECCVLSGRGLCDGPITRPEESYRVCVIQGDQV